MLSLPALNEDSKQYIQNSNIQMNIVNSGPHHVYDYFTTKISKSTLEMFYNMEKDERYLYFLKNGYLRRYEAKGDILYVEIPQIPKNLVIYRRPSNRLKNSEKLYLNKKDLPHIPLMEGEENLKLLSLETNLITKIDHLISLNNLLFLNLYENKITEIENLQNVNKLKALMLGKNQISRIKNLACLPDLEVLDLHSNRIKLIENLFPLKKLRILNLANNQLTSFVELINNKNLEDVNLRKNMIVSIPNLGTSFDKIKKINLGKNMISKVEFILEFKKLKKLEELYIEGNPVMYIRDTNKKFASLPLKFKDPNLKQIFMNNGVTSNNTVLSMGNVNTSGSSQLIRQSFMSSSGFQNSHEEKGNINNLARSSLYLSSNNLEKMNKTPKKPRITTYDSYNSNKNIKQIEGANISVLNGSQIRMATKSKQKLTTRNEMFQKGGENYSKNNNDTNLSEKERIKLLTEIETEWNKEYKYIVDNKFNGYNIKKLKETKMQKCHAEIERERQLNLFGNALEVLGYKEFFHVVHSIKFEFLNFDIISQKGNLEKFNNFTGLRCLIFHFNNIHGYYQLIKLENIKNLEYLTIKNNEICCSELLKYFLIYRLQNIKFFNDIEITKKDALISKKIFENFDQIISMCENIQKEKKLQEEKNKEANKEGVVNQKNGKADANAIKEGNGITKDNILTNSLENKQNVNIVNSCIEKQLYYDYIKLNLNDILEDIMDF